MQSEIITIGDEILIGQVVDTNSAWIAQQLNSIGLRVKQISSVSDSLDHIMTALAQAESRADIILLTGGLGPTSDDLTKPALCRYFNTGLRFDECVYHDIEQLFKSQGRPVSELNRRQAEVPAIATSIYNKRGTAPGFWIEQNSKLFISLPGVPYEMKPMVSDFVLPRLKERFSLPPLIHRTVLTQGLAESALAERIRSWEQTLPSHIRLAYLPAAGRVRLRLSASGSPDRVSAEIDQQISRLMPLIDEYVYGFDDDTLPGRVGQELLRQNATLVVSESCTGGMVCHLITSVPGSSAYFKGGLITYSNELKQHLLQVEASVLEQHGAVSKETVTAMATHARSLYHADYSLATSGIAGPTGGTPEKPVGTVWIAVASPDQLITRKLQLAGSRQHIIEITSLTVLHLLLKMITGKLSDEN
jgi:nicotinamide-nucleotide amidase